MIKNCKSYLEPERMKTRKCSLLFIWFDKFSTAILDGARKYKGFSFPSKLCFVKVSTKKRQVIGIVFLKNSSNGVLTLL